jgi:hypothetical protein
MGKAIAYLEETSVQDLFASPSETLHWLLLAERCNLTSFMRRCAAHAAIAYLEAGRLTRPEKGSTLALLPHITVDKSPK